MRQFHRFLLAGVLLTGGCTSPQSPVEPKPTSTTAPAKVAFDGVSLGQNAALAGGALAAAGYTAEKGGNYAKKPFHLKLQTDSHSNVNQASGTVQEIKVPGHPNLKHGEPRSEVTKALGPSSREKVDNYASRWVIYAPLDLTLVFDEDDKLKQAFLVHPAYEGPEETSEAQ
jgi:hypothetical protein